MLYENRVGGELLENDLVLASEATQALRKGLDQVLFGREDLVELTVCGLVAGGHLLLEGLPGLGKTELIKGLSELTGLLFRRIQFTPDLLPGDITGSLLLEQEEGKHRFVFQQGPLFANLILADEINRAGPKTQSALLEAMQEGAVTVGGETHSLPRPFFVLATQNPVELEGTYPLPEAQLDRFLFKLEITRTSEEVLRRVVKERLLGERQNAEPVIESATIGKLQSLARKVRLPEMVVNFIARLVNATHEGPGVRYGASPRGAIALAAGVRALALLAGRSHASFEDVRRLAVPVLAHRILLDYSARLEGLTAEKIVQKLAATLSVHGLEEPALLQST